MSKKGKKKTEKENDLRSRSARALVLLQSGSLSSSSSGSELDSPASLSQFALAAAGGGCFLGFLAALGAGNNNKELLINEQNYLDPKICYKICSNFDHFQTYTAIYCVHSELSREEKSKFEFEEKKFSLLLKREVCRRFCFGNTTFSNKLNIFP